MHVRIHMGNVQKGIERCLWAIGLLALAVWIGVWLNARHQQAEGERELERRIEGGKEQAPAPRAGVPRAPKLAEGDLIGRIDIPRLRMSTVVFEGTGDSVLRIGVGHLEGSPLPGEFGNVVLAAHRDTYFRELRNIRVRDTIDVVTPKGTRRYRVDSTTIVTPDHTEVLGPGSQPTLTLVTCYPFDWFGHAPKRFIVKAHEDDGNSGGRSVKSESRATPVSPKPRVQPLRVQTAEETAAVMRDVDYVAPAMVSTSSTVSAPARPVVRSRPVVENAVDSPPAAETVGEPEGKTVAAAPAGNRVVRGLKKINPKRLWGRIAGNE